MDKIVNTKDNCLPFSLIITRLVRRGQVGGKIELFLTT